MEDLKNQIMTLENSAYDQLMIWLATEERARRQSQPFIDGKMAEMVGKLREKGLVGAPELPENPKTIHDFPEWKVPADETGAYLQGDQVLHGVRIWEVAAALATGEPGVSGEWNEVTEKIFPPVGNGEKDAATTHTDVVEPWEIGGNYPLGQLVSFEGQVYRVLVGVFNADQAPNVSDFYELAEEQP